MEEKKVCSGDHSCHLCVLTAKLPLEEIKPLVDNPQFSEGRALAALYLARDILIQRGALSL